MRKLLLTLAVAALMVGCQQQQTSVQDFVSVENGHFVRGGKPYYYVGTNFWYGAILGSEGQGGDRDRLCRELDEMKRMGIDNLRILVGSDGQRGVKTKVEPTLQEAPGVYNDTILAGLDYLLQEMGKRQMVAVLYLNNSWEWSGGYGFYLEHAGLGRQPRPDEVGYPAFMEAMSKYATNEKAHQLFYDYVRFIISRTNRYTGVKYTDDPAIMSWQIGNEPRAFSKEALPAFEKWLSEASALIRSLDKNHLISIGSEGAWGCEGDYECYKRICADENVDYCNIHLWPYNWGWAKPDSLLEHLPRACQNTKEYIDRHLDICETLNKPLVMEEFGYPRDGFSFAPSSTTKARDGYYKYVFSLVADNAEQGGKFAGCNFWGWGGFAQPKHEQWQVGDDYTNDPAQEAQGLNSVFATDTTTLAIISQQVKRMDEEPETAQESVKKMIAGWNLGNSLDAFDSDITPGSPLKDYETCWGQPVTEEYLMQQMAAKGFNAIRVPVTWWQHVDSVGKVDPAWMERVETVVRYVLNNGMYCIVNVHHDTGASQEAWIKADSANYAANHERFKGLWTQIAIHFRDYGQRLLFEGYNEMLTGSNPNAEWSEPKDLKNLDIINKYAQDFVDAVRATGGNNLYRNLIVNTYSGAHTPNTLAKFVVPTDPCGSQNHLAVEVHSYDPWDWVNTEQMKWTPRCTEEVTRLFADLDKTFISKGYPVIIGEYGSNGVNEKTINGTSTLAQKQEAGRQAADIIRLSKQYGAAAFYWMGIVDRNDRRQSSFKWSMEQVADSIIANAR